MKQKASKTRKAKKNTRRPAGRKGKSSSRRKPIMRHSKEG